MLHYLQVLTFLTNTTFYVLLGVCMSYIMIIVYAMETKKLLAFLDDHRQVLEEIEEEKFSINYDNQVEQEVELELGMTMTHLKSKKV